ncbi:MAG TPA: hypothetical protein VGG03_03320 [Thermoanaerobaculia bacterium]
MSKIALADTLDEWDSLLTALDSDEELKKPHLLELRDEFAAKIQMTKFLAHEQQALAGRRQAVTQQLRITRSQGQDLAVKVRGALKVHFGHRWEGLVRFRIRPIRRRSRRVSEESGIAQFPVPEVQTGPVLAPEPPGADPEARPAEAVPDGARREEA